MRIHAVKAKNFMSLKLFSLDELDPLLSFIVGPNGSGKSSVLRAIRALIDGTLSIGRSQAFEDGRFLCAKGSAVEEFEVALDIEFDTDWERELIATYFCAALTHPDDVRNIFTSLETPVSANEEGMTIYANWLLDVIRPETMPFFFRGELRFYFRHFVRDYLKLTYTFHIDNVPLMISMTSQFSHYGLFSVGYPPISFYGNYPPIAHVLLDEWRKTNSYPAIRETISGKQLDTQVLPGSIDAKNFVLRLAGANAVMEVKTIPRFRSPYPGPHKLLNELTGRTFDEQQSVITFGELMYMLLSHGVVMTNNFRHPPERTYSYAASETSSDKSVIYDDRQVPIRLFELKNGNLAARQVYRSIQDSFGQLVGNGATFDVVASTAEDKLAIEIWTIENGTEIPITYHGAGIWESLVLSALLNDNRGKVILLDEPASNLHANMQRKFLSMIKSSQERRSGGQAVIITHSQHLLPTQAKDLSKIRRLQRVGSSTAVFGLGKQSKIPFDKLAKEMGDSSDLAGLLFASGVILVEGASETAAISIWYPSLKASQGRALADDNITLFSVNGKPNFPLHMQYLVEFGVPYAVICDVDALDPQKQDTIWEKLIELGKLSEEPTQSEFAELKRIAEACGIFTANTALSETKGFEQIPEIKQFLDANPSIAQRSKARQGVIIAQSMSCPRSVEETIQAALAWLQTSAIEEVTARARSQELHI